jgi:hypothetical protein
MQARQFKVDHQNLGIGFRADDVTREPERVDGREAAHEAHDGALDRRGKARVLHDVEVEPRCCEARAAHDDQMRDPRPLRRHVERRDRLARQPERCFAIQRHARARRRESAAQVEAVIVEYVIARLRSWREHREPMLDVGEVGHAVEQRTTSRIAKRSAREVDELGVDVVRRHRGADPVQPNFPHSTTFASGAPGRDADARRSIPVRFAAPTAAPCRDS